PVLCRQGFKGAIYATAATRDLCAPMLLDAAAVQEADARHIARLIERGEEIEPVEPLYREADVLPVLEQMVGLPYHRNQEIAPGRCRRARAGDHLRAQASARERQDSAGAGLRRFPAGGEIDRRVPAAPRVLRRRRARLAAADQLTLRLRGAAVRLGRGGFQGH